MTSRSIANISPQLCKFVSPFACFQCHQLPCYSSLQPPQPNINNNNAEFMCQICHNISTFALCYKWGGGRNIGGWVCCCLSSGPTHWMFLGTAEGEPFVILSKHYHLPLEKHKPPTPVTRWFPIELRFPFRIKCTEPSENCKEHDFWQN